MRQAPHFECVITPVDIRAARARIADAVYQSPLARSESLSSQVDAPLYLKLENLQMTGSFKERGALNRLLALSDAERAVGIVASSAGNHAQAVAYIARRLDISERTVKAHLTSAFARIGVVDRTQAAVWAQRHDL